MVFFVEALGSKTIGFLIVRPIVFVVVPLCAAPPIFRQAACMSYLILLLFCLAIALALFLNLSLLWALGAGYLLFFGYALSRGKSFRELADVSLDGAKTVFQICSTLLCIGMLTGSWRASGTIAYLVDFALGTITPDIFLPCIFLCNCAISFLLGSAFATGATMGVISMSVANALSFSPLLTGAAILSGCYVGDRCSPMSTSLLLINTLCTTAYHRMMRPLFKSTALAFVLTLALYALFSLSGHAEGEIPDTGALFALEYKMSWILAVPAVLVLVLAFLHIHVRNAVLISTAAAVLLCLFEQGQGGMDLAWSLVAGFSAEHQEVGRLMNGGGIVSMAEVVGIVLISSTYAGLFKAGGLLDGQEHLVQRLAAKNKFLPYLCSGLVSSAIACNQTLAIMLTNQLTGSLAEDKERHALDMADSVMLLSAVIPWSIASTVPLAMSGAPLSCIPLAFYLWLPAVIRLWYTPKM